MTPPAPPRAWRGLAALGPRPDAAELALSVAAGTGLAWLWVRLDEPWMRLGVPHPSLDLIGPGGEVLWALIALRWLAGALLLPVLEELFWRGFVMRRIAGLARRAGGPGPVDPRQVGPLAVLASTLGFALTHTEWLATALTGLVCAALYRRTGKLGSAIVAHAVTQGLVGGWIAVYGHWAYW